MHDSKHLNTKEEPTAKRRDYVKERLLCNVGSISVSSSDSSSHDEPNCHRNCKAANRERHKTTLNTSMKKDKKSGRSNTSTKTERHKTTLNTSVKKDKKSGRSNTSTKTERHKTTPNTSVKKDKKSGRSNTSTKTMAFTPSNMQRGSTKNTAGMFRGPSSVQKLDSDLRFSSVGKRYSSKVSGPNGAQISEWDNMRMSRVEKIVEEELEELMKGSSISERSAYGASQLASEALAVDSQDICTVNGGNDPEPASDTPTNRRARESMIVTYNEQRETETKISKLKWTQRKRKGGSFVRTRHSDAQVEARKSEVVMATPSAEDEPWEAYLQPGCYRLADIVAFPDVDTPIPKFAKFWVPKDNWKGTEGEGSGTLAIDFQELRRKVPIETATDILLRFYGCSLISDKSIGQVELGDEHVIQDFMYSKDYFRKYVTGVGAGIERHEFAHIDCPLSPLDESGFFLLGKWIEEGEATFLCITMFRVPQLHALYVPGGTIHSNDYLRGTWRTMLSWTADLPIDHVTLSSIEEDGSTKKDCFKIKDFDLLKD